MNNFLNKKTIKLSTTKNNLKYSTHKPAFDTVIQKSFNGKIAIYIDQLQGYGADKVIVKLANGLVEQGITVDLIVAKTNIKSDITINDLVNLIQFNSSRFNVIKNIVCLAQYISKEKPECLLSSIHFNNVALTCALILARTKTNLILRQANILEKQFKSYPFFISFILYNMLKLAYKKADLLIAPSQAVAFDMKKYLGAKPSKIKIIYNPTITSDIFEKAKEKINHKWFNKKYLVILSAGRLKPQKDFQTLLKAFAKVKQNYKQTKLVILGEGFQRKELENLAIELNIEKDVDLVGYQKNPYPFISNAHLFVSSSRYEGLPNVLIEAFALEKRIVATDSIGGSAEILQDGLYGELVPVNNPNLMAKAIERALNGISSKSKKPRAKHIFNQTEQVNKYIAAIKEVMMASELKSMK